MRRPSTLPWSSYVRRSQCQRPVPRSRCKARIGSKLQNLGASLGNLLENVKWITENVLRLLGL